MANQSPLAQAGTAAGAAVFSVVATGIAAGVMRPRVAQGSPLAPLTTQERLVGYGTPAISAFAAWTFREEMPGASGVLGAFAIVQTVLSIRYDRARKALLLAQSAQSTPAGMPYEPMPDWATSSYVYQSTGG